MKAMLEDGSVERAIARREIDWKHITPYAPWQGGFYGRLIRSVKHSLYKALGSRTVSWDVLSTMLAEIEAVLNSRPLTYQKENWEDQPLLRPIDFIQKDILVDYPLEYVNGTNEDETYHTPEETQLPRTRHDAETALRSSHELKERFWKLWRTQYLTSLREHHKVHMDTKRGSTTIPKVGTVVLICDSTQPRNTWKIGRIVCLRSNDSGITRELEIEMPNKRTIRRPVNLVVPLGLADDAVVNSA
ncbi:hypothetical protein RB195_010471 [Necator americanus]